MHKEEVTLLDHITAVRSALPEAGVSVVLFAGKARLETDMPEVLSLHRKVHSHETRFSRFPLKLFDSPIRYKLCSDC